MSKDRTPAPASSKPEIEAFLDKVRALGPAATAGKRGRLIFALDATMSRQPTWDTACALQGDMFREAAAVGGLDIQLVYFRGLTECRASGWVAGERQARRADGRHRLPRRPHPDRQGAGARPQGARRPARAGAWCSSATPWRRRSTICAPPPASSGCSACRSSCSRRATTPVAEQAYREIARLSRGAYCRFDTGAAHELGELLRAVAAYAAGGMQGARGDLSARRDRRRAEAAGAAEDRCRLWSSASWCWCSRCGRSTSFPRSIPKSARACSRPAAACWRSALRCSSDLRGEIGVAIPLGAFGLGLLGWLPFGPAGFFERTQKSAGQASRVRSAFLEMELDHDSGAMRGHDPRRPPPRRCARSARRRRRWSACSPNSTTKAARY